MNNMSEYHEWNGSRWEGTKKLSQWHFDPTKPPVPGKDSFTYVCRFDADFTESIARCMPEVSASTWSSRNKDKIKDELYTATAEEQDLIRAGADPKMEIFSRARADDVEQFQAIVEALGVDDATIKFHNQRTGQMLVTHIDNFAAREERENSFKVTELDKNPELIRRFAIMLSDWQLGQIWQIGNATWTQWRAGDCITWEWQDIPHATCNMGWHDRPLCQITGYVTDKTRAVLATAGTDQIKYI
jgi:hypothetical protein